MYWRALGSAWSQNDVPIRELIPRSGLVVWKLGLGELDTSAPRSDIGS